MCVYIYMYIYIYTYTCTGMYVHVCIYIYTYVYIYISTYVSYHNVCTSSGPVGILAPEEPRVLLDVCRYSVCIVYMCVYL